MLAKGADLVALKIRAIAEAHDIPVIEDKPLARSLNSAADGRAPAFPAEFYRAVAEIVHLIQQRKGGWPTGANRPASPPRRPLGRPGAHHRERAHRRGERIAPDRRRGAGRQIRNDHAANLADLVNSSTELFFKSGTLRYALSASVTAPWDATPVVSLDVPLPPRDGLGLLPAGRSDSGRRGIEIMDVLFDEKGLTERAKAERLMDALASARVGGRARAR